MPLVLAVDDSPVSREIYNSVLSPHCELELVNDAEQAWEVFNHSRFDLVITDVNLPGIDGLELLKKIRSHDLYSNTPVIIVSSNGDGIEDAKSIGADLWLLKPVNPQSLVNAVKKFIQGK